jgi:multiple sugar transport system ATP-binding protein
VFLFDEPLSNLDAQLRTQMRLEIKKLHQRVGNTIVFVTHDQVEAMTMADRIVIMKDGHIQQVGTPAEVYHSPANMFVAKFIGAPSMNMVPAQLSDQGLTLQSGQSIAGPWQAQGQSDVQVGVRPDDLTVAEEGTGLLNGTVTVQEPLGSETLIYVDTEAGEVIAKADGRTPPALGSRVALTAAPDTLHVFDAQTGVSLQ